MTDPTTDTALDTSEQEWWTDDGERFAVMDYDHNGVAQVTREVLRDLLARAGFTQAQPPPGTTAARDGRERLRRTALAADTTTTRGA